MAVNPSLLHTPGVDRAGRRQSRSRSRALPPEAGGDAQTPGHRRRALFFGTYDARRYPAVRVLQDGLAARGYELLECNVQLGLDTAGRVKMMRQPWRLPLLLARLLWAWTRLAIKAWRLPPVDVVVIGYMGHFDIHLARLLFPGTPRVLDQLVFARDTAVDRRARSRPLLRALGRLDRMALAAADIVRIDTSEQLSLVSRDVAARTVVVPVGAPTHWFWPPRKSTAPLLRVLFFGSFNPLQGTPVIGEALGQLAGDSGLAFTMVGGGQDFQETRAAAARNPSVTWIPWVEPEALPFLVASHDVTLGIFGTTPKALRVVPTKVFQGAAAGTAIVTSRTEPQRRALGGAAVYVPPGDAVALAEALRRLACDDSLVWHLKQAAFSQARERFRPASVVADLDVRIEQELHVRAAVVASRDLVSRPA